MAGFLRFLLAGGIAALFNMASRLLLSAFMPFEAAVALAYLIGMATAFLLMRSFVFGASERDPGAEFGRFALVNLVAFCAVWLVSVSLARIAFPAIGFTWHAETIAHVIGVLSPVVLSYWGHKAFTFRRPAA
jgi:putative flippase GtrA